MNLPIHDLTPSVPAVERCDGLVTTLHGPDTTGLIAAPAVVPRFAEPMRPLAVYHHIDGSSHTLFHTLAGSLMILADGAEAPAAIDAPMVETVYCALPRSGGFTAMTPSGPMEIDFIASEHRWSASQASPLSPAISITAISRGEMTVYTDSLTCKNVDFSRTNPQLSDADVRSLGADLCEAYSSLHSSAASAALWINPILCRYHLINAEGERVYSSSPMVMAPYGWQCTQALNATCSKSGTSLSVPAFPLSAGAFRLSLSITTPQAAALNGRGIKAVEVTVAPLNAPIDASEAMPYRITAPSTSSPGLSVALPGATDRFQPRTALWERNVLLLADRIDQLEERMAMVEIDGSPVECEVSNVSPRSLSQWTKAIASTLSASAIRNPRSASSSLLSAISAEATFVARAVTASSGVVAWADITPVRSTNPDIRQLCCEWLNHRWTGLLEVSLRSGATIYHRLGGNADAPTSWRPMVAYPRPDVASMTIYVDIPGIETYWSTARLTPSPDGLRSVSLAPELREVHFEPFGGDIPEPEVFAEAIDSDARQPGAVVYTSLSAPLTPLSAAIVSHSPILSLQPGIRSQSSWDFSRCHLYAFAADAIHAVNINPSAATITASVIHPSGVDSAEAVSRWSDGFAAIAAGRLIKVSASSARDLGPADAVALAPLLPFPHWLCLRDARGNLTLRSATGRSASLLSPICPDSMVAVDNRLWLLDPQATYIIAHPEELDPQSLRPIAYRSTVTAPFPLKPSFIHIDISASAFKGTISLRAHGGTGFDNSYPLLTLDIDGPINAPIVAHLQAPHRPYLTLHISAQATPDIRLTSITLL